MRHIMNADAGCILTTCKVKLENNQEKQIGDLRKGDRLEDGSTVVCLLKTKFYGEMIKINDLIITPYHPIIYEGEWQFPIDVVIKANLNNNVVNPFMSVIRAPKPNWVCTLVLDKKHLINAEGIKCIALAHGFTYGILEHAYYGTDKIIENLSSLEGWERGHICLESYQLQRDKKGLVNGITEPIYQQYVGL